jgi:hypothetical protein
MSDISNAQLLSYVFLFIMSLPILLAIWVVSYYLLDKFSHNLAPFLRWTRGLLAGVVLVYLLTVFDIDGDHMLIMMWLAAQSARGDGELWSSLVRIVKGDTEKPETDHSLP